MKNIVVDIFTKISKTVEFHGPLDKLLVDVDPEDYTRGKVINNQSFEDWWKEQEDYNKINGFANSLEKYFKTPEIKSKYPTISFNRQDFILNKNNYAKKIIELLFGKKDNISDIKMKRDEDIDSINPSTGFKSDGTYEK